MYNDAWTLVTYSGHVIPRSDGVNTIQGKIDTIIMTRSSPGDTIQELTLFWMRGLFLWYVDPTHLSMSRLSTLNSMRESTLSQNNSVYP